MEVKDIMNTNPLKVTPATTLKSLFELLQNYHYFPLVSVLDEESRVLGVIRPENLLDILRPQGAELLRNIPFVKIKEEVFDLEPNPSLGQLIIADDIMDRNFESINEAESLSGAYRFMRDFKKNNILVTDLEKRLVGVLGVFDIVKAMFKQKGVV